MLYAPITHRIEKITMKSYYGLKTQIKTMQISLLVVTTTAKTLLTNRSNGYKEATISNNKEQIKEPGNDAKIFSRSDVSFSRLSNA
jgi:hypothetical protein